MLIDRLIELSLGASQKLPHRPRKPPAQQQAVLRKLLKKAQYTAFGKYYDFAGLLSAADPAAAFRTAVPIFDYEQMTAAWWHRTQAGVPDIAWPGKVKYFALSSGTSGAKAKEIPVTKAMLKALKRGAFRMFSDLPDFGLHNFTAGWLSIGGTTQMERDGQRYLGYLSGINQAMQPAWARGFYRPGKQIAEIVNFDERINQIAAHAHEWDIGVLIGIPHWMQLTLEKILERHPGKTMREIWPNLSLIVSGGVANEPYRPVFRKLIGRDLPWMNTYLASEGMIAHQAHPDHVGMELLLDNGIYFEFVPFEEEYFDADGELVGQPPTLHIGEVEPQREYLMLISTCAGAWRYIIGDTIRFTDVAAGRIVISGRNKHYLNLCSEHLTVDNMNAAVTRTEALLDIHIPEFTIAPVRQGDYFAHHWYLGTDSELATDRIRDVLDQQLRELNDDYASERATSALRILADKVSVRSFYDWLESIGKDNGQSKVPRVMRGNTLQGWLRFLVEQGSG